MFATGLWFTLLVLLGDFYNPTQFSYAILIELRRRIVVYYVASRLHKQLDVFHNVFDFNAGAAIRTVDVVKDGVFVPGFLEIPFDFDGHERFDGRGNFHLGFYQIQVFFAVGLDKVQRVFSQIHRQLQLGDSSCLCSRETT